MSTKVACIVPFCSRTRWRRRGESSASEWICRDHWKLTSASARRRMRVLRKKARAFGADPLWAQLANDMWARLKAQAIERTAGIG